MLPHTKSILVTGIGGTGIVTIGHLLGMAAHLDGHGAGVIDMAGLAQKGGSVTCHVRIAPRPEDIKAIRVAAGEADVLIGADLVVSCAKPVLTALKKDHTLAILNTHETLPGEFTKDPLFSLPTQQLRQQIQDAAGGKAVFFDAVALAKHLFADTVQANLILLGYAAQSGDLPVSIQSLLQAIALNGVQVEQNQNALAIGRLIYCAPDLQSTLLQQNINTPSKPRSTQELIERRANQLKDYQSNGVKRKYMQTLDNFATGLKQRCASPETIDALTALAANSLYKVTAYKDEYEVARLYTSKDFKTQLRSEFSTYKRLNLHLAPPLLSKTDPVTGRPQKQSFGPWIFKVFSILKRFKRLRGTALDPFGYTSERKAERELKTHYSKLLGEVATRYADHQHAVAERLIAAPEQIRGFGPVKSASMKTYYASVQADLNALKQSPSQSTAPKPIAEVVEA